MIKRIYSIFTATLALLFMSRMALGQTEKTDDKDSLHWSIFAGAQGRIQTGNLNQVALGGNATVAVKNTRFSAEVSGLYTYAKIEDFVPVNDLWTYGIFKLIPDKPVYPVAIGLYGFSKSFAIDQSLVGGAGVGVNIIKPQPRRYIQANVYASYLSFEYKDLEAYKIPSSGLLVKMALPLIKKHLNISWEFHGYLGVSDTEMKGFQNQVFLNVPLTRQVSFTVNHTLFYSNIVNPGTKQINSFTLFGINFKTHK